MTRGVPMDPDRTTRTDRPTPDDALIAALVRDFVDDWRMPPQRLDDVTWRERAARRGGGGIRGGWTRRLVGAATLAIVATVALSFVAVWLTSPRRDAGHRRRARRHHPRAPRSRRPRRCRSSSRTATCPLPHRSWSRPAAPTGWRTCAPARSVAARVVLGRAIGDARPARRRLGLHLRFVERTQRRPDHHDRARPRGPRCGRRLGIDGPVSDDRGSARSLGVDELQPQLVSARISGSGDGRFAFVGWSRREAADGWTVGVDIVDLASLATVGERQFTLAEPAVVDGRGRVRTAPAVALSPSGDAVLLSSLWYEDIPTSATVPLGTDHWIVPFDGTSLGEPAPAGGTTGDVCDELDAGLLERRSADDPAYYAVCWSPNQRMLVKRMAAGGRLVDATDVPGPSGGFDGLTAVERRGDAVFIWSPDRRILTRFDLATTEIENSPAPTGAAGPSADGPLAAIGRGVGRWLAPTALAKVLLEPGIVVSPDGTRVYALGIDGPVGDDSSGSSGVFVFDAASLEPLGTWAPLADLSSIAISGDGRLPLRGRPAGRRRRRRGRPVPGVGHGLRHRRRFGPAGGRSARRRRSAPDGEGRPLTVGQPPAGGRSSDRR